MPLLLPDSNVFALGIATLNQERSPVEFHETGLELQINSTEGGTAFYQQSHLNPFLAEKWAPLDVKELPSDIPQQTTFLILQIKEMAITVTKIIQSLQNKEIWTNPKQYVIWTNTAAFR